MTAIIGIGMDLVNIDRFHRRLENPSFLTRVFTEAELNEANEHCDPAKVLATKFACKEAVMKCLGAGLRQGIWFPQICVMKQGDTRLNVDLARRAREIANEIVPCYWQLTSATKGTLLFAQAFLIAGKSPSGEALMPLIHPS